MNACVYTRVIFPQDVCEQPHTLTKNMHGLKKQPGLSSFILNRLSCPKTHQRIPSGALLRENILNKLKTKLNNPITCRWLFYRIKYFHHLKNRVKQRGSSHPSKNAVASSKSKSVVLSKELCGGTGTLWGAF